MSGLLLLRHAQSVWNATGRWQGWADPPLSEAGEQQAHRAGARLAGQEPFQLVVSSDLARAVRTAELLAAELLAASRLADGSGSPAEPTIEPGLREYDLGEWTGCTLEEIEARWPGGVARFGRGEAPPGGEDRACFGARVTAAGQRVAHLAGTAGAARVLVVAHGGVIRALARAAGRPEYRVGHLAGYWGWHEAAGLFPDRPVNLLDGDIEGVPADTGEASVAPGT